MPQAHTWLRHFTAFYSDLSNPDKVHQRANSIRTQWSFRKTGTMGTLASQAETDAWVQAPGSAGTYGRGSPPPAAGVRGYHPQKIWILHMQNPVIQSIFGRKMVRNAVHNSFLNTLTMGTPFPRFPLEMTGDKDCWNIEVFTWWPYEPTEMLRRHCQRMHS